MSAGTTVAGTGVLYCDNTGILGSYFCADPKVARGGTCASRAPDAPGRGHRSGSCRLPRECGPEKTCAEPLRQLRRHRNRAAFRGEETRRERVVTENRKARLTGIRVAAPDEAL